jgi:hypothetical protein
MAREEEMKMKKHQFIEEAEKVSTKEELDAFIDKMGKTQQDYDSIVWACYAAMKAAFNVMNRGPQGGISGFQAGFIGWQAVEDFMGMSQDSPKKILDYDNLLYPQYAEKFDKTISTETWNHIQEKAKKNLDTESGHPNVVAHWKSIRDGHIPFGFIVKDEQ